MSGRIDLGERIFAVEIYVGLENRNRIALVFLLLSFAGERAVMQCIWWAVSKRTDGLAWAADRVGGSKGSVFRHKSPLCIRSFFATYGS